MGHATQTNTAKSGSSIVAPLWADPVRSGSTYSRSGLFLFCASARAVISSVARISVVVELALKWKNQERLSDWELQWILINDASQRLSKSTRGS